jgi:hypothetical protein
MTRRLALGSRFRYLREMRVTRLLPLAAVALALVLGSGAGCGGGAKTPELAYKRFEAAVRAGDGGALFDSLDQQSRWAWMSVQKWHREAYDIVLSNYPEGSLRENEKRRFETAATATSARELFRLEFAPGVLPQLRALASSDARIEIAPSGTEAAAVLGSGARVPLALGRGWGFAGLAQQSLEQKDRAYHDLEVVRASAADYERAAARAGK